FTKYAWNKLLYLRDKGSTEIGGWGLCKDPNDPLLIHDIIVPKQTCSYAAVEFDDVDLDEVWLDLAIEQEMHSYQYSAIWIHTHPGISAHPSQTDEKTFSDIKHCDLFFAMLIVAKDSTYTCRIKMGTTSTLFDTTVVLVNEDAEDYSIYHDEWDKLYDDNI